MKIFKSKSFFACLIAGLLGCYNALDIKPTFRDKNYKNIVFAASVGGASHINWVLSICEELGLRGHNLSFLTTVSLWKI